MQHSETLLDPWNSSIPQGSTHSSKHRQATTGLCTALYYCVYYVLTVVSQHYPPSCANTLGLNIRRSHAPPLSGWRKRIIITRVSIVDREGNGKVEWLFWHLVWISAVDRSYSNSLYFLYLLFLLADRKGDETNAFLSVRNAVSRSVISDIICRYTC